jgi:WD40 repeat protein
MRRIALPRSIEPGTRRPLQRQTGQRFEPEAANAAAFIPTSVCVMKRSRRWRCQMSVRSPEASRPGPVLWPFRISATWDEWNHRRSHGARPAGGAGIETGRPLAALNLSNDGRFRAEWGGDLNLRIWRVSDGQSVFGDEPGKCANWDFSDDSRYLAVGRNDEVVRYDLAMGREINRWRARGIVHTLAFHPDGRQLAIGHASSPFASIHDAADGSLVADLRSAAWIGKSSRGIRTATASPSPAVRPAHPDLERAGNAKSRRSKATCSR